MAGVAQNVVVSSDSVVFDPEVSSSESFSLTLNSADGTSLQDLIDTELALRISNTNLNNTISTSNSTINDKNVNLLDFDAIPPLNSSSNLLDLDSNQQFLINEREHTSLHSINNNINNLTIEQQLITPLEPDVVVEKTDNVISDMKIVDNSDILNTTNENKITDTTSLLENDNAQLINNNKNEEHSVVNGESYNLINNDSEMIIVNKTEANLDSNIIETEHPKETGIGDSVNNFVTELTQITTSSSSITTTTSVCMSSGDSHNINSEKESTESVHVDHLISLDPVPCVENGSHILEEKQEAVVQKFIENEQEIKIPQFKDVLIVENDKGFDTWTTVAEAVQDDNLPEEPTVADKPIVIIEDTESKTTVEISLPNENDVAKEIETPEKLQNGHHTSDESDSVFEEVKSTQKNVKKEINSSVSSEDLTDASCLNQSHALSDRVVINESEFCNEMSETVTSEKKTVKKKKSSEGVDSTTTKTKKTKKTKKSEEKENHISVMTNGYASETIKAPLVIPTEEDDLSNVCVRDLKQTYCSEAAKSLQTVAKSTEEPVAASVPIRELRRSFGDLHKACENAELTPALEPPNINNAQMKARSLGDLRRLSDAPPKLSVHTGVSVKALKSSFNKFDQLQKKTLLHVRSSDSAKAAKTFNQGSTDSLTAAVNPSCKSCGKTVFAMEQIKAERAVWHKNCFRCKECNKQLTLDTYSSHEGVLYCKPHFKELFKPKAVLENDDEPASDKPDLGLDELNSLNVKSRFQVFEKGSDENNIDRSPSAVNVKRSPSILMKLAKFQKKGMDVGVTDESLNGIDYEESSSSDEDEDEDGVIRSSKLTERPTAFGKMEDVKRTWESGQAARKEERREERKQEIQSIRSRLFMGKQGKMKEMYEQAVAESEGRGGSGSARKEVEALKSDKARAVRERFERGEVLPSDSDEESSKKNKEQEDMSIFEEGISKKSRSLFLEMDANVAKTQTAPLSPVTQTNHHESPRRPMDVYMKRQVSTEDVVRSSDAIEDVTVETADISSKFKFFETYKTPEKQRKTFRITPPREGQVKTESPDREIYRDPAIVRSDDVVEDDSLVKRSKTTSKMLSIFRQMEEAKEPVPEGPKPLKRFTPPPDYKEEESGSEEEEESEEEEDEEESEEDTGIVRASDKIEDEFLKQAQNAARAKSLKEKFEHWEPEKQSKNNAINMLESDQASLDSTKSLRARFESLKSEQPKEKARPKVNRFVVQPTNDSVSSCAACDKKVYLLERVEFDGKVFHKACFRCTQSGCVLRMETFTLNNGQLYCIPHFKQLFKQKGNYDEAFGNNQHKRKWEGTTVNGTH